MRRSLYKLLNSYGVVHTEIYAIIQALKHISWRIYAPNQSEDVFQKHAEMKLKPRLMTILLICGQAEDETDDDSRDL